MALWAAERKERNGRKMQIWEKPHAAKMKTLVSQTTIEHTSSLFDWSRRQRREWKGGGGAVPHIQYHHAVSGPLREWRVVTYGPRAVMFFFRSSPFHHSD